MGQWTVHPDRQRDALHRWQAGLARAFVRLDAEPVGGSGVFSGRIEQVRMADIRVSRVVADPHRVIRRREHAARARQDVVFANLQIAGRGAVSIGRAEWAMAPMDLYIVPASDPYEIYHNAAFKLISIAIPAAHLPRGLMPGRLALSCSAAGREIARILSGFAALARDMPDHCEALQAQILGGLRLAASVKEEGSANEPGVLRAAVEAQIDRWHTDPGMSAGPLAAAFGISERSLHALFQGTGSTIGRRIESARMATARRLLEQTDMPVSSVAIRSGFRDPTYFSRVFKRFYGQSPRDWRHAGLS